MSTLFSTLAPAKVNLYLHVTGRRHDGFHLLDSLVVFTDVGDRIQVQVGQSFDFTVTGPFAEQVPQNMDNSAAQAAVLLAEALNRIPDIHITLEKNLPVAAGIGGGSSDAAAVLRTLVHIWPEAQAIDLAPLAEHLGADVPACLAAAPVIVGGIGEHVTPAADLPEIWLVLVNALTPVSTPAVFQQYHTMGTAFRKPGTGQTTDFWQDLLSQSNDLEAAACALVPQVGTVMTALRTLKDCHLVRMSGSGGTVFGAFKTQHAAEQAALDISRDFPHWWVRSTKVLTTVPCIQS